jgi:hypothetical protein
MNPRASTELNAEDLADAIEHLLSQEEPDPEELIAFMQLANEVSMALTKIGASSHGRRISVNGLIERLVQLHRALAVRLTAVVRQLTMPQPIPSVHLPGGAASIFKP